MRTWESRSREEAHLLNPAFCCSALTAAMYGYKETNNNGMPFPLIFMTLPIVLHKPTREALPINTRTSLPAWLLENGNAKVLFYERLISLKPHTREAIHFGLLMKWIVPEAGGIFQTDLGDSEINRISSYLTNEARECVMRSRFLGKWFALAGSLHTTMALWGIRP